MLTDLKNKYLEVEMEVALRVNQSTNVVRVGFIAIAVAVVALVILGVTVN